MAFSAKQFSFFLLLTLFSSLQIHARDSQFFNKIPSTQNDVAVPINKEALNNQQQEQDPTFLPEKDNGYGLYGHESGQNPPSTTAELSAAATPSEFKQPAHKYLPKNYNPVAYVTQPEDNINDSTEFSEERSFSTNAKNRNNYYNGGGAQNYYNNNKQEETEFRSYPTTTTAANKNNNNANYYYNGGSSFNSEPTNTRYSGGATRNGGGGFQPQGMSDTRFLENGKYFYDVEAEKYSNNHPYESLKGVRTSNEYNYNRNFYGNNAYENNNNENSVGGYQNQEEFLDDESLP